MKFHDFLSLLVWKNSIFALLLFCGLGLVVFVTELGFSAGSLSSTWTEVIWDLCSQGERGKMCVHMCVFVHECVGVHNIYTHVCLSTNNNTAFSHLSLSLILGLLRPWFWTAAQLLCWVQVDVLQPGTCSCATDPCKHSCRRFFQWVLKNKTFLYLFYTHSPSHNMLFCTNHSKT